MAGTRIAVAQVCMHWTIEQNLDEISRAMRLAQARGAAICAFAELAVPGFHREIVALAHPDRIAPAVAQVQALAARLGLAVALGAPSVGSAGEPGLRLGPRARLLAHRQLRAARHGLAGGLVAGDGGGHATMNPAGRQPGE